MRQSYFAEWKGNCYQRLRAKHGNTRDRYLSECSLGGPPLEALQRRSGKGKVMSSKEGCEGCMYGDGSREFAPLQSDDRGLPPPLWLGELRATRLQHRAGLRIGELQ